LTLKQKDVARIVGVDTTTVTNWEKNHTQPTLRLVPAIIGFLGYPPLDGANGPLGERIKTYRRLMGASQKRLAVLLDIDPTTLARWEKGETRPDEECRKRIDRLLATIIRPDCGLLTVD
jgi:transcriptional regulator with XRE-family HTH domain